MNIPWVRGSRPTLWLRSYSTCRVQSSETSLCCHMVRPCRLLCPSAWTVPLCSEGRCGLTDCGFSFHMFLSACCRCSREDSSARGRHSKPPEEETVISS